MATPSASVVIGDAGAGAGAGDSITGHGGGYPLATPAGSVFKGDAGAGDSIGGHGGL